ncbi:restriction system-associated AAA family ATPase [Vibrio cholerae]|nr:restriction system-associated AAA family ATPase [Vibrio cholerae]
MKLIRLKIIDADTCGGLLNGVIINFRNGLVETDAFSPLCLIGPNGTGKSQVLQIIAEIFQLAFSTFLPQEEKTKVNKSLEFELEYFISSSDDASSRLLLITEKVRNKVNLSLKLFNDGEWEAVESDNIDKYLPSLVVGYTSGDNETLSRPFYASRSRYAREVATSAMPTGDKNKVIKDSKLMLIDYGTSLEVLIANLLQNDNESRKYLLAEPKLNELHSFRCIIQLNHPGAPGKDGILLTKELEESIENLSKCCTCSNYEAKSRMYTFDFLVQDNTYLAFNHFWGKDALKLYSDFHKLSMLNDLMIKGNGVFKQDPYEKGFSSRLVEPVDNDKVFRFEKIKFLSNKSNTPVDYVSLSDGEHQLAQLLGTLCMVDFPNALFLMDEPESHFNPKWRVEFISKIMNLPTTSREKCKNEGKRSSQTFASQQECLITTHSPFVPSDMQSDNVLIFKKDPTTGKIESRNPNIQTYGSTFDTILEECFSISPPMSDLPKFEIEQLLKSDNVEEIKLGISRLGDSVERMYLADRIRMLKAKERQ